MVIQTLENSMSKRFNELQVGDHITTMAEITDIQYDIKHRIYLDSELQNALKQLYKVAGNWVPFSQLLMNKPQLRAHKTEFLNQLKAEKAIEVKEGKTAIRVRWVPRAEKGWVAGLDLELKSPAMLRIARGRKEFDEG